MDILDEFASAPRQDHNTSFFLRAMIRARSSLLPRPPVNASRESHCWEMTDTIRSIARDNRLDLGGVAIIDHKRASDFDKMVSLFHDLRRAKGLMADEARTLVSDPLYYGNLMVRSGLADGSVAGATNTTSHTVRAALALHRRPIGIQARVEFLFDGIAQQRIWTRRRNDLCRLWCRDRAECS